MHTAAAHNAPTPKVSPTLAVGRFAPTPSGRMHLGNVFAFLMAWLAATSAGGTVVLRIEDLDPRAQNATVAATLVSDLAWLGLTWSGTPMYQHNRASAYRGAIARLNAGGLTYPCFCTRAELHAATAPHASDGTYLYQGTCRNLTAAEVARRTRMRPPATRVRVPDATNANGTISFVDAVYGPRRETLATTCGDFLVRRSDGVVAYQLAVVVDDGAMGVTQVVRGCDLLGSTARQIWLCRQLGIESPAYAHIPLLTDRAGRRLSKRDHDLDLGVLRDQGYESSAIIGALGRAVGLASPRERVTPAQLAERFSWDVIRAHRSSIVVDTNFLF